MNSSSASMTRIVIALCTGLVGVALTGCSGDSVTVSFKKQSGNLVQFMDHELRKYGGTPTSNQPKPVMQAEWQYAEDKDGFQILIGQDKKMALIQALTGSLGEPLLRDEYPHLVYKEDRFGVGVVANLNSDPIHIICIKKGVL